MSMTTTPTTTTDKREPTLWNIWWTLAVIGATITFLAGLLEALGVWHDLGLGVGLMGTAVTILFGAAGATRTAVQQVDRRLDQLHDTLLHILRILDERLPDRPRA
jgi:hypothetical protein